MQEIKNIYRLLFDQGRFLDRSKGESFPTLRCRTPYLPAASKLPP
jgi:hypothetical protein